MNEEKARIILEEFIDSENNLMCTEPYICWKIGETSVTFDSDFTVEQLETIVWWIKNIDSIRLHEEKTKNRLSDLTLEEAQELMKNNPSVVMWKQ